MNMYGFEKFEASRVLKKAFLNKIVHVFGFFVLLPFWRYIVCWSFTENNALTKDFPEGAPKV